jgi:phage/plasmid-associated DNA primase
LGLPDEVQQATAAYREEMDMLGTYLKERCLVQPLAQVTSQALASDYRAWCDQNGEMPLRQQNLGQWLESQGFKSIRIGAKSVRGWRGLRLRTETDTPDATDTGLSEMAIPAGAHTTDGHASVVSVPSRWPMGRNYGCQADS